MFTKTRKIFTAILSLMLAVSMMAAPVYSVGIDYRAVVDPDIEPQWQNTMATATTLTFDGTLVSIKSVITGYSGTTFSNGSVILTKLTGTGAGTQVKWTGLSSSTNIFKFSNKSITATSGMYRVNVRITATRNGVSEIITAYKDAIY